VVEALGAVAGGAFDVLHSESKADAPRSALSAPQWQSL
jgi:hypothetical protein